MSILSTYVGAESIKYDVWIVDGLVQDGLEDRIFIEVGKHVRQLVGCFHVGVDDLVLRH